MSRLVGVIHLPPLPGSPRFSSTVGAIVRSAVDDARALADAGFDLVMLENFGDAPFYASRVPAVTVSAMTACATAVKDAVPTLPLGINVLRNDADAALSIAAVVGASCIRVNVHIGARVTDQGVLEGRAAETLRRRRELGADGIAVWADVDVKHSTPLGVARGAETDALAQEAEDLAKRAMADAILVTGSGTGHAVDLAKLEAVRRASHGVPVLVASGATVELLPELARRADGVIVGSALRPGATAGRPIDRALAVAFARAFRSAFRA